MVGRKVFFALSAVVLATTLEFSDASLTRRRRGSLLPAFGGFDDSLFGSNVFDSFGFPSTTMRRGLPSAAWLPSSSSSAQSAQKHPFAAIMDVFGNGNVFQRPSDTVPKQSLKSTGNEVQVATPPPVRTYDAHTDKTTGDLVIEVSAPQASGTSFDIEVDDDQRTVRIKEIWERSESHDLPGGGHRSSKSSGAFEKKWRVPATVVLDDISAEWDDASSTLVVRLPVDDTQNMLIEHDSDGSKSAVAPAQEAASAGQCSDDHRQKQLSQQKAYEQRMQEEYQERIRQYEEQRKAQIGRAHV